MARPDEFEPPTPWFVDWVSFAHNYMFAQDFIAPSP